MASDRGTGQVDRRRDDETEADEPRGGRYLVSKCADVVVFLKFSGVVLHKRV